MPAYQSANKPYGAADFRTFRAAKRAAYGAADKPYGAAHGGAVGSTDEPAHDATEWPAV